MMENDKDKIIEAMARAIFEEWWDRTQDERIRDDYRDEAKRAWIAARSTLDAVGWQIVPKVATQGMLNAAIDTDSFKLGDISPLGFRCSPQKMFARCYTAMLAAAPKLGDE
jgi:hypothetical protein